MIPVAIVSSVENTRQFLEDTLGFIRKSDHQMAFGDARIEIYESGDLPADLVPYPFDHVAFSMPSLQQFDQEMKANGAPYQKSFTPNGIATIPEFWGTGAQFVFFENDDHVPFEFCARVDGSTKNIGHEHFGIRAPNIDKVQSDFAHLAPQPIADFQLGSGDTQVDVRFIQVGDAVLEVFTDMADNGIPEGFGWVGYRMAS